ncbi:tetratricopeptide repeat protein [Marinobacter sp. F4216]|uniref:tetratricopeptide repeat protein n=1 Tax=Marinobacter sp. F4216 TaxID=2874281 RepID=UPI001CBCED63|nr:tetratricopeptide repeat protein [Marinobacter sp. F4216]MBZ2168913.1 tetratricopeptide repeat protein [Marinobacter sp. F4216]
MKFKAQIFRSVAVAVMSAQLLLVGCASTGKTVGNLSEPEDSEQLRLRADTAYEAGNYNLALKHYIKVLAQAPESAEVLYRVGFIQEQKESFREAEQAYSDALELQPEYTPARLGQALLRLRKGQVHRAFSDLEAIREQDQERLAAKLFPANEKNSPERGESKKTPAYRSSLNRLEKGGAGLRQYSAAETSDADLAEPAVVPHADNQKVKIRGAEQDGPLLALDEHSPLACYSALGIIFDLWERYGEARDHYSLVLVVNRDDAKTLNNMGYSHYLEGDLILAEHYFQRSVRAKPEFKRAWSNLALLYARLGKHQQAERTLRRVADTPDAMNDIGYFALLQGQTDVAKRYLQRAIDSSPTYFGLAQDNLRYAQQGWDDGN